MFAVYRPGAVDVITAVPVDVALPLLSVIVATPLATPFGTSQFSDADEDVSPSRAVEDLGHLKPPLQGEMAEAFDAWRKGRDNFGEELADVAIYLLRLAEMTGVDLQDEIETKMAKNAARVYQRLPNGVLAKSSGEAD